MELWSGDEHRLGLKPILRRVWARKGCRVQASVRQRYQWMYLYGFVKPESGQTSWLLMPTVNVEAFSLALSAFAAEVGCGSDKHLALVRGSRWVAQKLASGDPRRPPFALLALPFAGAAAC